jgi:hypothetical protein
MNIFYSEEENFNPVDITVTLEPGKLRTITIQCAPSCNGWVPHVALGNFEIVANTRCSTFPFLQLIFRAA